MSYTQSALQTELSKQREASAGWPWRLMTLSLVVLLTVAAVYVGMRFGFKDAYLSRALSQADAQSVQTSKSVTADEQKQIFNFYSQLSNIDTLLKKQGKGTVYFDAIEKSTLKTVVYASMNLTIDSKSVVIKMDGKTRTYSEVVQQMELYKKQLPNIREVKLVGARAGEIIANGISFTIQVTMDR